MTQRTRRSLLRSVGTAGVVLAGGCVGPLRDDGTAIADLRFHNLADERHTVTAVIERGGDPVRSRTVTLAPDGDEESTATVDLDGTGERGRYAVTATRQGDPSVTSTRIERQDGTACQSVAVDVTPAGTLEVYTAPVREDDCG